MDKDLEIKLRKVYEDQLREKILGPGYTKEVFACSEDCSDEILDQDPLKIYTTGILGPVGAAESTNYVVDNNQDDEDFDNVTSDSNYVEDDDGIGTSNDNRKDADDYTNDSIGSDHIGIVTCVEGGTTKIRVEVKYATYVKIQDSEYPQVKVKLGDNYAMLDELFAKYDEHQDFVKELEKHCNEKSLKTLITCDSESKTISIRKRLTINPKKQPYINESNLLEVNFLVGRLFSSLYRRIDHAYTLDFEVTDNSEVDERPFANSDDLNYCYKVYQAKGKKYIKFHVRNRKNNSDGKVKYSDCLFQTEVKMIPLDDKLKVFSEPVNMQIDKENTINEYIYRKVKNYGKGVGCAAVWDEDGKWIKTSYMPHNDVKKFSSQLDERYCEALKIKASQIQDCCQLFNLSHWETDNKALIARLRSFVQGYTNWHIRQQQIAQNDKTQKNAETAESILKLQQELNERLNENINYLESTPEALTCFKLANTAMLIQMTIARNEHFKKNRPVADITEDKETLDKLIWFKNNDQSAQNAPARYYPFQLAFLLMNVKSTFEQQDRYHKDVVDLIWFPTGGGKTEAYLALTALTIISRRRRSSDTSKTRGVSVIMRYTLRLLTSQQFERASYLICALEFMRTNRALAANLGEVPITIGQWIGNSKREQWDHRNGKWGRYNNMPASERACATNPHPVTYCPWCGGKLVGNSNAEFGYIRYNQVKCLNRNCHFFDGLPIFYVDEALYNNPPTLLFATVDKLAQIYKTEPAKLLGRGTDTMSPDLIIQDELHLISGPLGSMVGFFESIVEKMAGKDGRIPKIIASTATTRNTDKLVKSLYARDVRIFPAQGITYDDNYFSHVENESLRRHIAICPQGYPVKAEIRVIAQLILARISMLKFYLAELGVDLKDTKAVNQAISNDQKLNTELDNYWSLVLYYNSLKDLGRTRSRISGEIFENLRYQKRYMHIPASLNFVWSGVDKRIKEFTSREDSSRIKDMLTAAESVTEFAPISEQHETLRVMKAIDLVLASNMISVGIDISRWDIMMMSGQPRSTSEYIQSSSRVGRTHKGLVVNLYSPQRIREYSMYENFTSYHNAYYRYVEPLSATPVTLQTIDNMVLNNIRACYQQYICIGCERDETINTIIDDFTKRFEMPKEIIDYMRNEMLKRWDEDEYVNSLRDIDPNCYAKISQISY